MTTEIDTNLWSFDEHPDILLHETGPRQERRREERRRQEWREEVRHRERLVMSPIKRVPWFQYILIKAIERGGKDQ